MCVCVWRSQMEHPLSLFFFGSFSSDCLCERHLLYMSVPVCECENTNTSVGMLNALPPLQKETGELYCG